MSVVSRQKMRVQDRSENREISRLRREAGLTYHSQRDNQAERDWRRQLLTMPDDTRGLTARLFGDPLPGRSALDLREAR